jgi:site-specific recombinase XerD
MNAVVNMDVLASQGVSHATRHFFAESTAASTRRAYRSDLRIFVEWCESKGAVALPATAETVADFVSAEAEGGISPSTLNRRIAAIKFAHEAAGLVSPTGNKLVSATLKGIKRQVGTKPVKKVAATVDKIYQMITGCDAMTLQGKRDRAILLLGFAGAFRRSELSELTLGDIETVPDGLKVTIGRSKTDQEGVGQTIAIPNGKLNAVGILMEYIAAAGITEGFVFRSVRKGGNLQDQALSPYSIACVVKKYAAAVGMNPDDFGGHSLRAGFITSAAEAGANLFKIMDVSRHKSVQTVRGYVRSAELFKEHAGSSFL